MLHMQHHFLCNISYVVVAVSMGKTVLSVILWLSCPDFYGNVESRSISLDVVRIFTNTSLSQCAFNLVWEELTH